MKQFIFFLRDKSTHLIMIINARVTFVAKFNKRFQAKLIIFVFIVIWFLFFINYNHFMNIIFSDGWTVSLSCNSPIKWWMVDSTTNYIQFFFWLSPWYKAIILPGCWSPFYPRMNARNKGLMLPKCMFFLDTPVCVQLSLMGNDFAKYFFRQNSQKK